MPVRPSLNGTRPDNPITPIADAWGRYFALTISYPNPTIGPKA
jgi:hypothetical protein